MAINTDITTGQIRTTLKEYGKIYERYQKRLETYILTFPIIRWLKGMQRPHHPMYLQTRLYLQGEVIIEIRCSQGLYLAVRDGKNGYLIRVTSDGAEEKTPLLGSRGMNISLETEEMMKEVADILIRELRRPENEIFRKENEDKRNRMEQKIWK